MSRADGSTIVPVDMVQGIVQQLATVSQHTTSATTAMRHLVSEIAGLREMRTRDTTTMVEALAGATERNGSPGMIDGGGSEDDESSDKEVAGEGPGVSQVRWEPRAFLGVVRGGGREEGAKAAVGSGGDYLCDGGVGRACERYGWRW